MTEENQPVVEENQPVKNEYGVLDFFRNINNPVQALKRDFQETYRRFNEDESGWKYPNKVLKPIKNYTERFLEWIFEPREWERRNNSAFYRRLGVKKFKLPFKKTEDALESTIRKHFKVNMPRIEDVRNGDCAENLRKYEKMTRLYEAACWKATEYCLFPGIPLIAYEWGLKGVGIAAAAWIPTVGLPLLVQRMNRARIYNFLDKIEPKNKTVDETKSKEQNSEEQK